MLERKHYQLILNNLLDFKERKSRAAFATDKEATWLLFDVYALRVEKYELIFNLPAFKLNEIENFSSTILSSEPEAVPFMRSPISTEIKKIKTHLTLRKFTSETGKSLWINEAYLKIFSPNDYTFKGTDPQKPIFCYNQYDLLIGLILPFNVKEGDIDGACL